MKLVRDDARKQVVVWLFTVALLIFSMVILGGLTRLTDSGLSMVDWQPLMGAVPPLNEADWMAVFEDYKAYPEYQQHNKGMSLDEFKFIFFMEYSHRLLGRFIGLVFFFPFVYFLARKVLSGKMIRRFAVLFILGGLQGVIGWYMVKSGLVDMPRVSQYRLTLHLSMAILVFSMSIWYALDLIAPNSGQDRDALVGLRRFVLFMTTLTGLQITVGGFVAGLRAGRFFNTWPLMGDSFVPGGLLSTPTFMANFFENPVMVQFIHRNLALVVAALVLAFCVMGFRRFKSRHLRIGLVALAIMLVVQVKLGIMTLLMHVPVSLASAHQACALLLWAVLLYFCHQVGRASHAS